MDNYKYIANEPSFWSRVGFAEDPTRYDKDKNIKFYNENWDDFITEHKNFAEIGVKLHTSIIHNGWVGIDEYDFSAVDKTLDAIYSVSPEIRYLPRIKLNPPIEWSLANPSEVALSEKADRSPEGIVKLVKKLSPYYNTNGFTDNVPGDDGYAYLFSFSSEKWFEDIKIALEKLINHIENSKYSDRIAGYQLGMGMCGENAYWGAWSPQERWGDYGITASKSFEKYCLDKYKTYDKIKQVYNIDEIISPQSLIPSPEKRSHTPADIEDFFRKDNVHATDYEMFINECITDRICSLAAFTKKLSGGKPIGTFYGYIYTAYPSESGHLGIEKLLNCDDIDFIASPKGYYRCNPGGPGGTQATSMSAGRKKIWFDEIDNGTYIGQTSHNKANLATTLEETNTVFWREVSKNLAWGNLNFWIMDLLGGWFMDADIMKKLGKIIKFNSDMRLKERSSVSEILLVVDEKSAYYYNCDGKMTGSHFKGILNEMTTELLSCGAPVDVYRLEDLKELDLSAYKMVVFANTYFINKENAKIIQKILESKICIFNYAPGIREPKYDIKNVKKITGMSIKPYNGTFSDSDGYNCGVKLPPVEICNCDGLEIIDTYIDGAVKTARLGNAILCAAPYYGSKEFHETAKLSGCHMYAKPGTTIYADSRFVGVFPSETINEIKMPKEACYKDLISQKTYIGQNINSAFSEKSATILIKED